MPRLLLAIHTAIYRVNRRPQGVGRIRLRVALAQGAVHKAAIGFVGNAVIDACRLLDSHALHQALDDHPDADVAAFVTEDIYRDVISHGYGGLDPRAFHLTEVSIPDKGFAASAYLFVPGPTVDEKLVPRFTGVEGFSSTLTRVAPWAALGLTGGGALFALHELADHEHDDQDLDDLDHPGHDVAGPHHQEARIDPAAYAETSLGGTSPEEFDDDADDILDHPDHLEDPDEEDWI
ncbi:hypothetical protein ABGB08_23350 [Acrocarpospora sp. B8E8]